MKPRCRASSLLRMESKCSCHYLAPLRRPRITLIDLHTQSPCSSISSGGGSRKANSSTQACVCADVIEREHAVILSHRLEFYHSSNCCITVCSKHRRITCGREVLDRDFSLCCSSTQRASKICPLLQSLLDDSTF